jgi:thiol-disulfide isomerase/thioredoxin
MVEGHPVTSQRYFIAGILLVALVVGLGGIVRQMRKADGGPGAATVTAGEPATISFFRDPKPAPSFTVTTIDGKTISMESLRGKVVLVNFWATWCPPCRAEIPDLIALQSKYADKVVVLGLSEDEGSPDAVRRFAEQFKINYPIAMVTPEIEKLFAGVNGLPTTFVIDPQGRTVQKHVGLLNAALTELETRSLAGLAVNAKLEYVDADKPVGLENAAQAKEIPGVELAALSVEKRVEALQKLNTDPCTCGCGLTVARCRVDDPHCNVSLPAAKKIVEEIVARN